MYSSIYFVISALLTIMQHKCYRNNCRLHSLGNHDKKVSAHVLYRHHFLSKYFPSIVGWVCRCGTLRSEGWLCMSYLLVTRFSVCRRGKRSKFRMVHQCWSQIQNGFKVPCTVCAEETEGSLLLNSLAWCMTLMHSYFEDIQIRLQGGKWCWCGSLEV